MFSASSGMLPMLSDISCESATFMCGPRLNKAKENRSEIILVNWKQQLGPGPSNSHQVQIFTSGLRHRCELWKLIPVITFSGCYSSIRLRPDVLIQDRESRVDLISLKSKLEQLGWRSSSVKLTHANCVSLAQDGGKHFREIWRFLKLHCGIFNMENTKKKKKNLNIFLKYWTQRQPSRYDWWRNQRHDVAVHSHVSPLAIILCKFNHHHHILLETELISN